MQIRKPIVDDFFRRTSENGCALFLRRALWHVLCSSSKRDRRFPRKRLWFEGGYLPVAQANFQAGKQRLKTSIKGLLLRRRRKVSHNSKRGQVGNSLQLTQERERLDNYQPVLKLAPCGNCRIPHVLEYPAEDGRKCVEALRLLNAVFKVGKARRRLTVIISSEIGRVFNS